MTRLVQLAFAFAQIGLGAFGGGLSVLPQVEYQFVTRMAWLTHADFTQLVALAQVAPGPIAINAATLVGYQQGGFAGSVVAVSALVAAPLAVVTLVLALLGRAPAERVSGFQRAVAPLVAALLTLATLPPIRVTAANGVWPVAIFLVSIPLITKAALFKRYPVLLFILGGFLAFLLA